MVSPSNADELDFHLGEKIIILTSLLPIKKNQLQMNLDLNIKGKIIKLPKENKISLKLWNR